MDGARKGQGGAGPGQARPERERPWPVHALFGQRVAGDDALLRLAGLRFAQIGAAAEVYADTPDQLDHVLRFVPPGGSLPLVHLNRGINLLHEDGRAAVADFAGRFAGRVAGLVVHDQRDMAAQTDRLVAALRDLDACLGTRPDGPTCFLEYAAGHDLGWFAGLAQRLEAAERVSLCVDIGHIGTRLASSAFLLRHHDLSLRQLSAADDRLPALVADVQDAVRTALPAVLDVIRSLGSTGKPVHFHLHDGHPLVRGLPDHFSFLARLPIPFCYQGRRSLSTMYGPSGLDLIVAAAVAAFGQGASFTVEVHQAEGRLPLADAASLFEHWRDTVNAERANYWHSVLSENVMLAAQSAAAASRG